jgi:hypothetical protein
MLVTEKGFISFAAREGRGAGRAERRESDETFCNHRPRFPGYCRVMNW